MFFSIFAVVKFSANIFRFILILFVAAVIAVSCTKTIDGNLPVGKTQLVVDANIETNTPPMALLTKTSPVFGGLDLNDLSSFFIHNATVWVKDKTTGDSTQLIEFCLNDLPLDSADKADLLKNLGFVAKDSTPLPNVCVYAVPDILNYYTTGTCNFYGKELHNYSLSIDADSFQSYGETSIVQHLSPDSLGYEGLSDPHYDTLVNVFVYVNVPASLGHFLRYWTKRNSELYYAPDPSVYDDKLFAGSTLRLPLSRGEAPNTPGSDADGYYWWGDTVTVKWANIDAGTFNFFNTLENDGSGSPFSPQVRVQSNMSNAIGVFAGYSTSYVSLIIPPQQH